MINPSLPHCVIEEVRNIIDTKVYKQVEKHWAHSKKKKKKIDEDIFATDTNRCSVVHQIEHQCAAAIFKIL